MALRYLYSATTTHPLPAVPRSTRTSGRFSGLPRPNHDGARQKWSLGESSWRSATRSSGAARTEL